MENVRNANFGSALPANQIVYLLIRKQLVMRLKFMQLYQADSKTWDLKFRVSSLESKL